MKSLTIIAVAIMFTSGQTFASSRLTCSLKTKVGEDGADRPIMKVLASDTQALSPDTAIVLEGNESGGASSFEVSIYNDQIQVTIRDIQNDRSSYSRVNGVDLTKPKLTVLGFLNADNLKTKSRELVLQCFGN